MPVKRAYPVAVRRGSVTVKVYRQKSADVFTVAFYEHGQRQRLSFRDEAEARKAADEMADRLSRHNGTSLTLAGTDLVEYCRAQEDIDAHGTYRTKDTILKIYDALGEAQRTGQPHQTLLDPPPTTRPAALRAVAEWRTGSRVAYA